jgi:hypothetical protein
MSEHKRPKLGATGKFPEGKLNEDDEGELTMGVANDGKLVHVNFGKPVHWFAVPPDKALELASLLTGHAMAIKRN